MAKTLADAKNSSLNLVKQGSAPAAPASGRVRLYVTTGNVISFVDDAGVVRSAVMQSGAAILSQLTVSGNTVLTGTLASGAQTVTGNVAASGQVSAGSLAVSGNTVLTGTLASGAQTVTGNIAASGLISAGSLAVSGDSTVGVLNSGNHNITGNLVASGSLTAASLTASGNVTASTMTANGSLSVNAGQSTSILQGFTNTFRAAGGAASGNPTIITEANRGTLVSPTALEANDRIATWTARARNAGGGMVEHASLWFEMVQVSPLPRTAFVVRIENAGVTEEVLRLNGRPTITGSRGGNAAVASLLTAMAGMNLIIDNTTA